MKKYPVSRKDNLVVQEMDGEVLIYDLSENKAFCLNETSSLVWHGCNGSRSVSDLANFAADALGSNVNEDIIWLALEELGKERLVENIELPSPAFRGMSRRDVIKKVGLGTMVALPIVASIAAPRAIHAQSDACVNQTCECNTLMGAMNSEPCITFPQLEDGGGEMGTLIGVSCPPSCTCIRANQGNAGGTCNTSRVVS